MSIEDRAEKWIEDNYHTPFNESFANFAKSEFPREREEACREFVEKVNELHFKQAMYHPDAMWTAFKEMFGVDL
jgi:hypothetical protein